MAVVLEGVEHAHAKVSSVRIFSVEFLEHVHLQLGGFSVLVDVLDDLQRRERVVPQVPALGHFAEGAFAQRRDDLVAVLQHVAGQVGQVAVGVVGHDGPLLGRVRGDRGRHGRTRARRAVVGIGGRRRRRRTRRRARGRERLRIQRGICGVR